jgi:hypothetical protein
MFKKILNIKQKPITTNKDLKINEKKFLANVYKISNLLKNIKQYE